MKEMLFKTYILNKHQFVALRWNGIDFEWVLRFKIIQFWREDVTKNIILRWVNQCFVNGLDVTENLNWNWFNFRAIQLHKLAHFVHNWQKVECSCLKTLQTRFRGQRGPRKDLKGAWEIFQRWWEVGLWFYGNVLLCILPILARIQGTSL